MAKRGMLCPFSGRLCKNCSAYIGRHYFMCYKPGYRGYLGDEKRSRKENGAQSVTNRKTDFSVPELKHRENLDPFTRED